MAMYETVLATEIGAGDRWANGTLSDSSFDIIVDLNVIDVILFGPKAQIPEARLSGNVTSGRQRSFADLITPLKRDPAITPPSENGTPSVPPGGNTPPSGTNPPPLPPAFPPG